MNAPYALSTGKVLWEWNALHTSVFRMFWAFIGNHGTTPRDLATDLWNAARSDDQQRQMLLALAENLVFQHRPTLGRIKWLLGVIAEFAAYRNLAAHVSMSIEKLHASDHYYIGSELDGRKSIHGLKHVLVSFRTPEFWTLLAEDLYVLSQYADQLGFYLAVKEPLFPLPYKPQLRSLPIVRETNREAGQLASSIQRRRHRR